LAENEAQLKQLTSILQLVEDDGGQEEVKVNRELAKHGLTRREELEQLIDKTKAAIDKAKEAKHKESMR
jgi:hypothetical protein